MLTEEKIENILDIAKETSKETLTEKENLDFDIFIKKVKTLTPVQIKKVSITVVSLAKGDLETASAKLGDLFTFIISDLNACKKTIKQLEGKQNEV